MLVCAQADLFCDKPVSKIRGRLGVFQNVFGRRLASACFFIGEKCVSQEKERILYKPYSEEFGDEKDFCIKRLKTLELLLKFQIKN
jgi:hypothetical protein